MANVSVVAAKPQQILIVEGDPLAPNTIPACLQQGDTIYRADTATFYSMGANGVVAGTGSPSAHEHSGADITSGVIAKERLGTGTPDVSKVLRGDGSWSAEGGTPDAHVTTHHSGGSDALTLSSIAGTITAGQHGTPAGDLHPGYALDADLAAHEAAADPHAVYQKESEKGVSGGYAELDGSTLVPVTRVPDLAIAKITGLQSALDGKQALDTDLTTIAGLTATTDNFMVASASAWASRTPAQARTHMGLGTAAITAATDYATAAQGTKADSAVQPARTVAGHALSADVTVSKSDVGLGNVDNTTDVGKPVSTAQQTALDLKANVTAKLDDFGTPDDNTDLNATSGRHGLLPKLSGSASDLLTGAGTWSAIPGASDLQLSKNAPTGDVTITAGYSASVFRKYTIASGKKLTIGSGAIMRVC